MVIYYLKQQLKVVINGVFCPIVFFSTFVIVHDTKQHHIMTHLRVY